MIKKNWLISYSFNSVTIKVNRHVLFLSASLDKYFGTPLGTTLGPLFLKILFYDLYIFIKYVVFIGYADNYVPNVFIYLFIWTLFNVAVVFIK